MLDRGRGDAAHPYRFARNSRTPTCRLIEVGGSHERDRKISTRVRARRARRIGPGRGAGDSQRELLGSARAPPHPAHAGAAVRAHRKGTPVTHGYTPGRFALTDAPEFPFMGDTAEVTAVAYQRIYERMLAGANEHRDVVLLSVFTHGPGQMYNTKRAIGALKDLDGLKIRVGGGLVNEITKNLGAVPMLKPAPESYELLSTGVADGLFFPKESPLSFKLVPLIKHVTYVPGGLYNVSFAWIANQAKWNQIPEADRRAIQPLLGEALARRSGLAWDAADAKGEAAVREAKIPIVIASAQFRAEIKARTEPLEREWIEKKAKPKGVDGEAVLKALRAEIAKLRSEEHT